MDRCGQRCAPGCGACQELVALPPIRSYPLPGPRIKGRRQVNTQDQVAPLENVLAPEPSETEAGGTDGVTRMTKTGLAAQVSPQRTP